MARRSNLDGLIHCDACGEDYSATYKRCPFCGEPPQGSRPSRAARDLQADDLEDEDDGYVFDGQDAFDDGPEPVRPVRAKGGKRLATSSGSRHAGTSSRASASGRPSGSVRPSGDRRGSGMQGDDRRPPEPINWPRLITFLCSLVIIAAALVIVFTVIYPQLRQDPAPASSSSQAPDGSEQPSLSPSPSGQEAPLTGLSLDTTQLTLPAGGTHQFVLALEPADWVGAPVWSSSDVSAATVDATGLVTNVNATASTAQVTITVTAGGLTAQCTVSCSGVETVTSDPPAVTTPSGGALTPGATGIIVNADSGLRVRSGPGTSYEVPASLLNGDAVTVLADAGDGWYEITYIGSGGQENTGYIMGEYISVS